jgi:hypothetical protein
MKGLFHRAVKQTFRAFRLQEINAFLLDTRIIKGSPKPVRSGTARWQRR